MIELTLVDLQRGTRVRWEWGDGAASDAARAASLQPVGRVVTREDIPHMGCQVGIVTDDDPNWVLDPTIMLAKGRKLYRAP